MEKKNTLDFNTVHECNRCLDCKTLHPQVSLINLENPCLEQNTVKFEFYAILLIEDCPDECSCCGRKYYDYSNATMVFLKPGEVFRMSKEKTLPSKGFLLVFHPDLLFQTTLKNHINNYTFFHCHKEEALLLSQRETEKVTCCLWNIEEELHHSIDTHERQFITRENKNKAILKKMEQLLEDYIGSGKLQSGKLPAPDYFAERLNLSSAYFTDLLKFETGKTLEQYFQFKRLEAAKRMLMESGTTSTVVARQLGYPNVQYFSFVFKKITSVSPSDYRYSQS